MRTEKSAEEELKKQTKRMDSNMHAVFSVTQVAFVSQSGQFRFALIG